MLKITLFIWPLIVALSCSIPKNNKDIQLTNTSSILKYKDSINSSLNNFKKQKSLPFSAGEYTFLITKYSQNDKKTVLIEQADRGDNNHREKRYYLKNGNLVLYTEKNSIRKHDTIHYSEARAFFRNGIQFAADAKSATDKELLSITHFQKSKPITVDVYKALHRYEDALTQTGQFDLTFEEIIEYPKAIYIVLAHQDLNPYRSSLLIRKQDNFIRELINNPVSYRGRKVKMDWEKKDREYVYVSGGFR